MIAHSQCELAVIVDSAKTPIEHTNDFDFNEPSTNRLVLNEQQLKVHELLAELSLQKDQFGQWYLAAIESLHEQRRDYLSHSAHSIREITDKLPNRAGLPKYETPLPKTRDAVTKLLQIKSESFESGWEGATINGKLAGVLGELEDLKPIFDATPRKHRIKSALELRDPYCQGISPVHRRERDYEFKKLGEFFENVAHHHHSPSHESFLANLESFENLLITYLSPVTGAQQNEILGVIQFPPNHENEARLHELLRHNGANLIFLLERLKDPLWIPFLEGLELFKNPRDGEPTEDGGMIYRSDPALFCLMRLAPFAPAEVLAILEKLPKTDNPQILNQVVRCMIGIEDKALIPLCLKVLKSKLDKSQSGYWICFEEILGVWWRLNAHDEMAELLRTYLVCLIKCSETHRSQRDWELREIDRNAIAELATVQPITVAKLVFKALCVWARVEIQKCKNDSPLFGVSAEKFEDPDCNNPPTYWLEDFRSHSIGTHDLEETLAHRLFQIGNSVFERGDSKDISEFDNLLRSNPWHLFTRLRWQLYADHPKKTRDFARQEVISRIPRLSRVDATHGYEMAQMLEKHSEMHRDLFLKPDEVQTLCARVQSGPLHDDGQLVNESAYQEKFQLKQLYPIRCLLEGKDLELFNRLRERAPKIRLDAFKPFSSGGAKMIENVPPKKALEMHAMSDTELWDFLNNWVPNPKCPDPEKWWIEEDVSALGIKFAELLESTPDRFPASNEWWKNLKRPSVLLKPLDRATNRISETLKSSSESGLAPTDNDWRNWFGLAAWITQQRNEPPCISDADSSVGELQDRDWDWACMVVVKFLSAALKSKFEMPSDLITKTGLILQKLVQDRDKNLENKDKPWIDDWLTTAINSVRGSAVDGLLQFSLFHKRKSGNPDPEDWIYDLVISRLQKIDESPAVFAIIGSHLRLMLHLFYDQLKSHPEWLFPPDRKECCNTLIVSHVRYDNPMPKILDALPRLPDAAIDCLSEMNELSETKKETRGDFGARLGTHLGFYYWNAAFSNQSTADAVFDRYFATAKPKHRAAFIRDVARIFETSTDSTEYSDLACKLWDRRFNKIKSDLVNNKCECVDVDGELSAFIDWLGCEGFPFDWRLKNVFAVIKLIKKGPSSGFIIRKLEDFSSNPERLHASLEILGALITKDSGEIQWSYPKMDVSLILKRGFSSTKQATRNLAMQIQDELLRYGLFEYLELNAEPTAE